MKTTVMGAVMVAIKEKTAKGFAFKASDADKKVLKMMLKDGVIEEKTFQMGSKFVKHYELTATGRGILEMAGV
jgi:hypothetical protein